MDVGTGDVTEVILEVVGGVGEASSVVIIVDKVTVAVELSTSVTQKSKSLPQKFSGGSRRAPDLEPDG